MDKRWVPAALLVVVILGGGYVRFRDLGRRDFRFDELLHYYPAVAMERGEGPVLPSGVEYRRGIDYTRLVRIALRFDWPAETAVRFPAALFGFLGLTVFAAIAWAIGGPWAAVWSTLLLGVYPEAVGQSQMGRFYTYQLFFGIIALYTGWQTVRNAGSAEDPSLRAVRKQWLWVVATLGAFFLAYRVQVTTASVVAAWGLCVALAATSDFMRRGWPAWRRSVPFHLCALGAVSFLAVLVAAPQAIADMALSSQDVSDSAVQAGHTATRSYYWSLMNVMPVAVSLGPLAFVVVGLKNPKLAIYLLTWFGLPLVLHTFVFPWKEDRFVLLAMPGLFLALSIAATRGSAALYRALSRALKNIPSGPRWAAVGPGMAVVAAAFWVIVTTPAVHIARARPNRPELARWSQVGAVLTERPELASLPLGASWPLGCLFYCGRVNFSVVGNPALMQGLGLVERGVGVPVLPTAETIKQHFGDFGEVLIAVHAWAWDLRFVPAELQEILVTEGEELCRDRCGNIRLFHWRWSRD